MLLLYIGTKEHRTESFAVEVFPECVFVSDFNNFYTHTCTQSSENNLFILL